MAEIPSKIFDQNYIRIPKQDKVVESDDEWNRCGMWILKNQNLPGSLSWIDETWSRIQVLYEKGVLIMIKASTAAMAGNSNQAGIILCYTKPGEEEIERAANEIRKIVHYENYMYYKMNSMTQKEISQRHGHKRIARYMHSFKGFFYRNNLERGWILVNDSQRENPRNSLSVERWNTKKFAHKGFFQLPSKSSDTRAVMKPENESLGLHASLRFTIFCSLEEVENCLSEADRLWIMGKKLIRERTVYQITCEKLKFCSNVAKICFMILDKLDIQSSVNLCDKIKEEAQVFCFIYVITENSRYRYSPEKELEFLLGDNEEI